MATKRKAKKPAKAKGKTAKSARPAKRAVSAKPAAGGRSPKQAFLDTYAKEQATTLRVLRAFPPGQSDFRPHPRSQSVGELAYTLLFEQELKRRAISGGPVMGGGSPPTKPATFEAAIEQFDKGYRTVAEQITKTPDSRLFGTVQFPTSPGQMGDWPVLDFLWMMLHDHIHHRGQLTVLVRMSGGKVPSIYGPSADEPWS